MIKIFLLNIIFAVFHLSAFESSVKLSSIGLEAVAVCGQLNGLITDGVAISKNSRIDLPNNSHWLDGLPVKSVVAKFPVFDIDNFKVLSNSHRNKFKFFESGVSPPVAYF